MVGGENGETLRHRGKIPKSSETPTKLQGDGYYVWATRAKKSSARDKWERGTKGMDQKVICTTNKYIGRRKCGWGLSKK